MATDQRDVRYEVRYGWRGRSGGAVGLVVIAVLVVAGIVINPGGDRLVYVAGPLFLALVIALLVRQVRPFLRRQVALRVDAAGVVLGGFGPRAGGSRTYAWDRVIRIQVYEVDVMRAAPDDGPHRTDTSRWVQVDLRDGAPERTELSGARLDEAALVRAVQALMPQVTVSVGGHYDESTDPARDPGRPPGPEHLAEGMSRFVRRLRQDRAGSSEG
ncbi:hypothetical protein AGRA3207_000839 [Actinomadura graeca]|uniref:PH domain-containing protein n=1 Tax=Actinomadura graeca TaxID=2750812 RepID=A0ABX8QNN4_9ACTN|nr:hypothetical protein [Actinomadura graeca]QXJ20175.1 hypothetical protein AGRA3207_000839 [Actinomadura graeca]